MNMKSDKLQIEISLNPKKEKNRTKLNKKKEMKNIFIEFKSTCSNNKLLCSCGNDDY